MREEVSKKVFLRLLVTLPLISFVVLATNFQVVNAEPTTWTVDDDLLDYPDADFTMIQEAISVAVSGDTILVYPGTYSENNILINEGITLSLQSGVTMRSPSGGGLAIYGQLIAQGTELEPIIFTSNQSSPAPGDWINIVFSDTSVDANYDETGNYLNGSILQYCTLEYGGGSDIAALKIISSSPFVDHCTIINNANEGIYIKDGSPRIVNSTISNNLDHGISAYGSGLIFVCGNTIVGNQPSSYGGGIHTYSDMIVINNTIADNLGAGYGGGIYAYSDISIIANMISNNSASYGGGIYNDVGYSANINNNRIINNSASVDGGGIFCGGYYNRLISDNIIRENKAEAAGGGIYAGGRVNISRNLINNNSAGNGGGIYDATGDLIIHHTFNYNVITNNSATSYGGGISVNYHPVIEYSNIYNNTPYDISNSNSQGTLDVIAVNNWWGTTNATNIQAHIYDWYDDASLGIVDYTPYLTNLNAPVLDNPAHITYEEQTTGHSISWTATNAPPGTYIIYKDDVEIASGNWVSSTPITINVEGLPTGKYNYTIVVYDASKNAATDSVIVTVVSSTLLALNTDKNSYMQGEKVFITAITPPYTDVTFEVDYPNATIHSLFTNQSDAHGAAFYSFNLEENSPVGTYTVFASTATATNSTTFEVTEFSDITPPQITGLTHSPVDPQPTDTVAIRANITDAESYIISVTLYYLTDGGSWSSQAMTGDDSHYSTTIGPFTHGTTVQYYVNATNDEGLLAISSTLSFLVQDTLDPSLSNLAHDPSQPTTEQSINITIDVIDFGSVIQSVVLFTSSDGGSTWTTEPMSGTGSTYSTTVGPFDVGIIQYYVNATDNVGNSQVSSIQSFSVVEPTATLSVSLGGIFTPGGTIQANISVPNNFNVSKTMLVVLQVLRADRVPLIPVFQWITIDAYTTQEIILTVNIPTTAPIGSYLVQSQLLTDFPRNGGYTVDYQEKTINVS
ncbi:MAG: right-handed parallel beta-helix repeat-containing protein [Candidatus Hodarchaeales archaeon]|jgi:hypothetical protein